MCAKGIDESGIKVLANNKKARFLYFVTETLECGIELQGTEVKSIKTGKFSFSDSYAKIEKDELWLVALHISLYAFGNIHNHDPERIRKLLAHKKEIIRLRRKIQEKGLTLVPLRFYLVKGLVKVEIGVCKGKKLHDKRDVIKNRDMNRESDREYKIK
ncbi:MAG: SsrA-binding protein SmpB [Spirochaetales bacterium]|nr:SsrA-binding protein SmpB [Spirochaetales bacterium]